MIRSTPAANIACSTVSMFAESKAGRSRLVDVTPTALRTASAPENAFSSAARSARDVTTTTRELGGISDALWPRADGRRESDAFITAHAEDALTQAARSPDDRHATRQKAFPMVGRWRRH